MLRHVPLCGRHAVIISLPLALGCYLAFESREAAQHLSGRIQGSLPLI